MKFTFIGMADELRPWFSPEVLAEIAAGQVFAGGMRHRLAVSELLTDGAEWIEIAPPMDEVFARLERHKNVVVFASGDPLFFGFAATVRRRLPDAELRIFPALNSLQTLAHRLVMPYHDMRTVSLTGREWAGLDRALIEGTGLIGVLTDRTKIPLAIARRLLEFGFCGYRMAVGERLGNPAERVWEGALEEVPEFAMPNCVILHGQPRRAVLGIPDGEFALLDGRAKMITKMPVRLAALAMLGLESARVFWDIGFCTGSVSVEARLRFAHLQVHAFEIRPECRRLIDENARRHGAPGIEVHIGDFFETAPVWPTTPLPESVGLTDPAARPDAVFIGGHGGRLAEMVARVASALVPQGSLVFNSVSSDSAATFEAACADAGLTLAARTRLAVDDHNPIEILKAVKL